jgi:hypothetical protein
MEATCSSETSVDFQRTTRRYIPEDITPHNHCCENLIFYKISKFVGWSLAYFTGNLLPALAECLVSALDVKITSISNYILFIKTEARIKNKKPYTKNQIFS